MNADPRYLAFYAVAAVMAVGSSKDGKNESWRDKPASFHLTKALRHATTHLMQREGHAEPDGENHLMLALTRLAMALTIEEGA